MKTISIGGWETTFSEGVEIFPNDALVSATLMIQEWTSVYEKEETWVFENYGVPSIVIRIDCFLDSIKGMYGIEVEDRPMGIGITSLINGQFAVKLEKFIKFWPRIALISSVQRSGGDDYIWILPSQSKNDLLIVRCSPDEKDFYRYRNRSVSTISSEGNKSYGEKLGIWKRISWGEEIPWEEAFVLKPLQGTKCRDVTIWLPKNDEMKINGLSVKKRELRGNSTKSKVEQVLFSNGTMYIQPFVSPMVCPHISANDKPYFMLYRLFFLFDPIKRKYAPAGGLWTARPYQLLLHGASDAIFGPLMIED